MCSTGVRLIASRIVILLGSWTNMMEASSE